MLNSPRNEPEACSMIFAITDRFTPGVVTTTPNR
jgi:hypothetical protein